MNDFDINSIKPIKLNKNIPLFKNKASKFYKNHKLVSDSLSQAILEGDKEAFYEILSALLSMINKEELSRRSKVPIATIRRMAAGANFNIESMLKVTCAINKGLAA